jgi:phosphatidylserine decarboxylase
MPAFTHQYVDRTTGLIRDERLYSDRLINLIYSSARETMPAVFRALTGAVWTRVLGYLNYDLMLGAKITGNRRFLAELGVDLGECVEPAEKLDTACKVFERQIRYWDCRPMPADDAAIVSPADSRVLVGSFAEASSLFIKEKFFSFDELLGDRPGWREAFRGGDFAVFRLTPDKYHYNHIPVAGVVRDIYEISGSFHSCNPGAVVTLVTPYSKNKRVVTIIDTDIEGGTGVGLVAMIEVVAMMIGRIEQCYSGQRYDNPVAVTPGLFVSKGQPKSLYRPGSSTDVLIFQPGRVRFADDIIANLRATAQSRFTLGFGQPLVETDVQVRSWIGSAVKCD